MDERRDELWEGGVWEQPKSACPAPSDGTTPPDGITLPDGTTLPNGTPPPHTSERYTMSVKGKAPMPSRKRGLLVVGVVLLAMIGGMLLLGALFGSAMLELPDTLQNWYDDRTISDAPDIPRAETGSGVTLTLVGEGEAPLAYHEIYQKCAPSMVSIEAQDDAGYSTGTGIVLTEDGYVLTNAHVVAGANAVQVVFRDNQRQEAALVGFHADEDVAVLKVEVNGLTPAEFGDSNLLEIGNPVAALGDPLGYRATLTDGIVSALDRDVEMDGVTMSLIQTSAAINFGNSGGALLNEYGQVVGITTIKIVSEDGSAEALGFAIPSRRVKFVADRLIDGQAVRRAAFGITVDTRSVSGGGLAVMAVEEGSDAAAQGLQVGDVLLAADGREVLTSEDLSRVKLDRDVGEEISLTVLRDGEQREITVKLIEDKT